MEKMNLVTKNLTDENIQRILELFPNVATEKEDENGKLKTAIDFAKLKQELSEVVVDGEESYDFTWVGKKEAMIEANRPIRKTLRPDKDSSVNWDTTENIYIEGDNLDALKLLQESYMGKVKMIYIDPPYNTGKDFVYRDNFTQDKNSYEEEIGAKDEEGNRLFQNTESNGRFHSDWCSMMYPRLKLARNLLSDDGVIFISIDDNEVRNLKNICDEIFGEDNFIAMAARRKNKLVMKGDNTFKNVIEPLIIYAKNKKNVVFQYTQTEKVTSDFSVISAGYGEKNINFQAKELNFRIKNGKVLAKKYPSLNLKDDIIIENYKNINPVTIEAEFKWSSEKLHEKLETNAYILIKNIDNMTPRIYFETNTAKPLDYIDEKYGHVTNEAGIQNLKSLNLDKFFDYPKPLDYIKFLGNISNDKDCIILDFFSGSATTAHATMQLNAEDGGNRKFIMVQLPEITNEKSEAYKNGYKNICEIGKERIRRAGKKIQEENPDKTLDIGFRVFKVDDTNMKDVYYTPNEYSQNLLSSLESNIKDDRTDEDLLYGCLLDWGVELSLPHRIEMIDGKRVHIVNEDDLIACFEENISETVVKEIAKKQPTRVVFRDSSFNSDDNRINVEEIFKLQSPNTRVKVI